MIETINHVFGLAPYLRRSREQCRLARTRTASNPFLRTALVRAVRFGLLSGNLKCFIPDEFVN